MDQHQSDIMSRVIMKLCKSLHLSRLRRWSYVCMLIKRTKSNLHIWKV